MIVHHLVGDRIDRRGSFDLVRFAVEFPFPGPVGLLSVFVYSIGGQLYPSRAGFGVSDGIIVAGAGGELRFALVELPGAQMRIGSEGCSGGRETQCRSYQHGTSYFHALIPNT